MTERRSVYDWKNECISLEEGLYLTGRRSVYDWNKVFISLEKGVYRTGKRTVYYWKKEVCFKTNYSTIQKRSFSLASTKKKLKLVYF